MGHFLRGDGDLRLRTFDGFRRLAAPSELGGVGVGASAVELRWLKLDSDGEPIEDLFLFDLPADLEARFGVFPVSERRDVMLPVPCRLDQLIGRVRDAMQAVGANLQAAAKESGKVIFTRFALTPVYELAAWEIEGALERLGQALPDPLRDRLSRDGLLAERGRGTESNAPSSPWLDELAAALPKPFEYLLHMVTWLLWHMAEDENGCCKLRVVDDSDLHVTGYGGAIRRLVPRRKISLEEARAKLDSQVEQLNAMLDADETAQLAQRFTALDTALDLSATDHSAVRALEASACVWDRLGRSDRAKVDRTWAELLAPKSRTKKR